MKDQSIQIKGEQPPDLLQSPVGQSRLVLLVVAQEKPVDTEVKVVVAVAVAVGLGLGVEVGVQAMAEV